MLFLRSQIFTKLNEMPPKAREIAKTTKPLVVRPAISDASLLYIPTNAVEGYQERIENDIDWTLPEAGARHHKQQCLRDNIATLRFTEAFQNKIKKSILNSFLDDKSSLSLEEQWELLLPLTLWDIDKMANEEGKICFRNINCITDDMVKLIKKAVKIGDREVLKKDLKEVNILRVNDSEMTELDKGLTEYKRLVSLNLCGNFIADLDARFIPPGVRTLELQANRISKIEGFTENLPNDLIYMGLSKNLLSNESIAGIASLPSHITVLDLSDNDIYHLEPLLVALVKLPNLTALQLAGNPCSVCMAYGRHTLMRLLRLRWLDSRKILTTDRSADPFEPHPDDLNSTYFYFTVFRIMSAPQPPKPEKGTITTFHVELELPLLDSTRRRFLMFRRNESLTEMLPTPEDDGWTLSKMPSTIVDAVDDDGSAHESDLFKRLTTKNSREVCHFTTFESNRIPWNKIMNFQEPTVRLFCPNLAALRDTFRTVITVRLIYSMTYAGKLGKGDKKSVSTIRTSGEQRVVIASIRCSLKHPDWSQPSQHFHWDDSLGTNEALHWGDGDLSILQYSQAPVKQTKAKPETDIGSSKQQFPENLTCHFGFGIDMLRA